MLVLMLLILSVVIYPAAAQDTTTAPQIDLDAIKAYLLEKTDALEQSSNTLYQIAQQYYDLAQAANFDYAALAQQPDAMNIFQQARDAWMVASPLYEQMEGIVGGVELAVRLRRDHRRGRIR